MSYPKFKYHISESPKIFNNAIEELEAGDDWKESPADFEVKQVIEEEKIVEEIVEEKKVKTSKSKK